MKYLQSTIFWLSFFIFVSCGNSEEGEALSFSNSLSATIDGKTFTADEVILVKSADPNSGAQVIVITASAGPNSEEVMSFNLFNINGKGTYPLGSNSNWASYTEDALKTTEIFITPTSGGSFTITESNEKGMKGTFEFEAYGNGENDVLVKNGKFEASY